MAKQWKRWRDQTAFKRTVRDVLEASPQQKDVLLERASRHSPVPDASRQLEELIADWLVYVDQKGNVRLTEWQHNNLVQATGQGDYLGAMMFLFEKGVWHPDMERFGLTDGGEAASEEAARAQRELAAKMDTMPVSDKVRPVEGAQSGESVYGAVTDGAERITSAVATATVETFKDEKHEFSIQEIRERTPGISPVELAVELGDWISSNVEQYIDNRETVFRMYLCVKSDMGMPVSSMFQRLYLSVPDVDEGKGITGALVDALYDALDARLAEAKRILSDDAEFQRHLFERMAFFYELTGFVVKDGKVSQAMLQKMQGRVSINELVFDPISLTTTVAQGVGRHEGGKVREGRQKVVVKKEEMPAGFGIEIEISLKPKDSVPLSIY